MISRISILVIPDHITATVLVLVMNAVQCSTNPVELSAVKQWRAGARSCGENPLGLPLPPLWQVGHTQLTLDISNN